MRWPEGLKTQGGMMQKQMVWSSCRVSNPEFPSPWWKFRIITYRLLLFDYYSLLKKSAIYRTAYTRSPLSLLECEMRRLDSRFPVVSTLLRWYNSVHSFHRVEGRTRSARPSCRIARPSHALRWVVAIIAPFTVLFYVAAAAVRPLVLVQTRTNTIGYFFDIFVIGLLLEAKGMVSKEITIAEKKNCGASAPW